MIRETGLNLGPGFAYDYINNAWIQVPISQTAQTKKPSSLDADNAWDSDAGEITESTQSKIALTLLQITDKLGEISATKAHSPHRSHSKSPVPVLSPEKTEYEKVMESYYEQNAPDVDRDPTCAPIAAHLIPPLEKWFWSPYPADDIKKSIEKCRRPTNANAVRQNWINEEMYHKIGSKGKKYDQKLRYINNSLLRSAQPATIVWDKLAAMEAALKAHGDVNADNKAVLSVNDKVFNISELREQMDLSLKLAGVTNVQLFQHRRYHLKSFLNSQYQDLCNYSQPMDWRMFGGDVKGSIRNITELNKVSKKIVKQNTRTSSRSNDFLAGGNPSSWRGGRSRYYYQNNCSYRNNDRHRRSRSRSRGRGHQTNNQFQRGNNQRSSRGRSHRK